MVLYRNREHGERLNEGGRVLLNITSAMYRLRLYLSKSLGIQIIVSDLSL